VYAGRVAPDRSAVLPRLTIAYNGANHLWPGSNHHRGNLSWWCRTAPGRPGPAPRWTGSPWPQAWL